MTLFDVAKSITWTDNKNIFFVPKDEANNAELNLIDYLNDASLNVIDMDIDILTDLNKTLETGNKKQVEEYIMNNLDGFTKYDDGVYAFITGARDKSTSVLYDINDSLFLIHPNLSIKDKLKISPLNLIELLKTKKAIAHALNANRIQEK